MEVIELIEEMCNICENLRQKGYWIRFVPTMGALHDGHASLIRRANSDKNADNYHEENTHSSSSTCRLPLACSSNNNNDQLKRTVCQQNPSSELNGPNSLQMRILNPETKLLNEENHNVNDVLRRKLQEKIVVIVSIFVNHKQFNNPNDFSNYPKNLESDLEICRSLNVDYVFAPTSNQMYPIRTKQSIKSYPTTQDASISNHCIVQPPTNKLALDLEGKSRPGHFEGVLTIVCKLFNIIKPHDAYFGEKDYQQLILVQNMVQDLNMNIQIKPCKTIRDLDLLPLSSRNVRLKENERKIASVMYNVLCDAKDAIESKQLTSSSTYDIIGGLNDHYQSHTSLYNDSIDCKNLDTIILASMLTTLSLNLSDDSLDLIDINYLELRCAKDITQLVYVESCDFEGFDCENGCVKSQLNLANNISSPILKTRLLISVIIGEVRLLDNMEVLLNLDKR